MKERGRAKSQSVPSHNEQENKYHSLKFPHDFIDFLRIPSTATTTAAYQNHSSPSNGEPIIRPHAWLAQEIPKPQNQRRHRRRVQLRRLHDDLLLRRRRVRGSRPWPLLRSRREADLRLRLRPDNVRLRRASPNPIREPLRHRDERVQAPKHPHLRQTSRGIRRVRPVVLVGPRPHAAEPPLRLLRHLPRLHLPREEAAGEGLPAADDLRLPPRKRRRIRCLLPEHSDDSVLPESSEVEVRVQVPPVRAGVQEGRAEGEAARADRDRAELLRPQGDGGERRPPVARRRQRPEAGQGGVRGPEGGTAVE